MDKPVVSYSMLGSLERCEFAYSLNYEQGWKPKKVPSYFDIGSMGHFLLNKYHRGELTLADLFDQANVWVADGKTKIEEAGIVVPLIKRYIEDYSPVADKGWDILDSEYHFQIPLTTPQGREFELQGYVDLLVNIHGRVWIVEHKFSTRFKSATECAMDGQTPTYASALREQGIEVFGIVYNMLNTYPYKNVGAQPVEKLFKREATYRTKIELDNFKHNLGLQVDELIDLQDRTYRIRNLKNECARCFYVNPCQMGLKGIDMLPILEAEFKKKGGEKSAAADPEPSDNGSLVEFIL